MPYCPKCDMEFVEGITVCSDCGGPLAESKEAADAIKKQQQEEYLAQKQTEYETMMAEWEEKNCEGAEEETAKPQPYVPNTRVYVKKSQQYDDLKSSASAFFLVGGAMCIASLLCWTNVISLPLSGSSRLLTQGVITIMGIGCMIVAIRSLQSAKTVKNQVNEEESATESLIQWFCSSYSGEELDRQLSNESMDLSPEELSLKRFSLIQDILITNHDLADQSYVDMLSEEIYSKLYEE